MASGVAAAAIQIKYLIVENYILLVVLSKGLRDDSTVY